MGFTTLRNSLLGLFFVDAICVGFGDGADYAVLSNNMERAVVLSILKFFAPLTLTLFFYVDGIVIGKRIPTFSLWVFNATLPVSAPAYLIWSRGWNGVGWTVALGIGLALSCGVGVSGSDVLRIFY